MEGPDAQYVQGSASNFPSILFEGRAGSRVCFHDHAKLVVDRLTTACSNTTNGLAQGGEFNNKPLLSSARLTNHEIFVN